MTEPTAPETPEERARALYRTAAAICDRDLKTAIELRQLAGKIERGGSLTQPATAARRNVIGAALRSYKSETEQYLLTYKSWPLTNPYDPACCDTCRREHARWETGEVSRKLLVERLDTINDALSEVLADV